MALKGTANQSCQDPYNTIIQCDLIPKTTASVTDALDESEL